MSEPHHTDPSDAEASVDPAFAPWRRAHRAASYGLGALAIAHCAMTVAFSMSRPSDAVWLLGTGLGLLLLAAMNLAHVGLVPCAMPTAPVVRASNWVFVLFSVGALVVAPEPLGAMIAVALVVQAGAGHRTLKGAV